MAARNKILFLLISFLVTVVLFFIFLYFSVPKIVNSEIVKKKMNAYVLQKTGGSIALKKSEIHLFPLPHINFQQVSISLPNKANGFIQSVDLYPEVWSLIRGNVRLSKIGFESPSFTIVLSEDMEKTSLELIEEKIRQFVHDMTSLAPDLFMTVQKGKLDLTKADRVVFSFDTIQSRLAASGKSLDISLTCTSNLWDNLSFTASLQAEDLKSGGAVKIINFQPHNLFTQLFPKMARHIGDSDIDLSVKFQTLGLRQIRAEIKSSVPGLVLIRGQNHVKIEDLNFKGKIEIEPNSVSVLLSEFNSTHPDLNISGKYTLDRTSGIMGLDLEGKSIEVQSIRSSALSLGGDIPVIRNIFNIMQDGSIPVLQFHSGGKSPDDLGRLENMQISGRIEKGDIFIPAKDLRFKNVTGDVFISKGILEGKNIEASIENQYGSKGNLKIGLKKKNAPFHLDILMKADVAQLPSLLKQKNLIKNEAVLKEMDRLSDTQGTAQGRLILGDRLDSLHVVTDISQINIVTHYEPLPFPLMITGGQVFFDEKSIKVANLDGNLGKSSFTNLTARLNINDKHDFEITDGQMRISADEIYPWITSFEKIKPVLKDVPSMSGIIAISSLTLKGSLYQPKDWRFTVHGETNKFTLDASFLPGRAEDTTGMFRITRDELSLKNIRTRMSDSVLNISGTFREFPADMSTIALSLQGEVGPKVTSWISRLIKLPPDFAVRSPFSISSSTLLWEKDTKTTFDGRLVFGSGTEVSIKLTKTPDELSVHELAIKDRDTNVAANIMLNKKSIDIIYKGILASRTFNTIFTQNKFSDSSLHGDFRTHIFLKDPGQSTTEGVIQGENLPIPWKFDIPLVVQKISLTAEKKRISVETAQLLLGKEKFVLKGTIDTAPTPVSVDMDLSADNINWETVENIIQQTKNRDEMKTAGLPEDFPLKGTLRIQSGFFKYRQFTWEPFYADVNFDRNTVSVHAKRAALCGISTTGNVRIDDSGAELDINLYAGKLEFKPTILCLSDKKVDMTGTFGMKADIKAKGKIDTIAQSFYGNFDISAKNGKIFKARPLDKTLDIVNKTENFKGKLPDLDKTVISYRVLRMRGTMKENILKVDEGILDASIFGILAQGEFNLSNHTIDLNALVAPVNIVARIVNKIPVLGHILGGNIVSVPVKIKGDIYDPQVTFLSPSAIGSAFLGIMERIIKLPVTIIEPILPGKK